MKKILVFLVLLLLTTGCSNEYNLNFNNNEIKSTININFSLDEYTNNYLKTNSDYNDNLTIDEKESQLESDMESLILPAFINNKELSYIKSKYIKSNGKYDIEYTYFYDYDNFNNNYYLNRCFENSFYEELDTAYYYRFSGNFNCNYNSNKLIVTSGNSVLNSNHDNIENNKYIWNIKEKDNNIEFSISKIKREKSISIIEIVGYAVVILLLFLSIIVYSNVKKKY